LNHGDEVDRTVQELAYAVFSNWSTKALAVAANPLRVASRSRAAAGFDPKRLVQPREASLVGDRLW